MGGDYLANNDANRGAFIIQRVIMQRDNITCVRAVSVNYVRKLRDREAARSLRRADLPPELQPRIIGSGV
jgi:hypothetical protein